MQKTTYTRGFTLVETVAAIAVFGAMSAVLAPIGGSIQGSSLDTKSQWVHHGLARRQLMYVADHDGMFTGPNSSGLEWGRDPLGGLPNPGIDTLAFDTVGGNPTTQGDWITPLVGDAYGLSANRAIRMQQMLEMTADPTATHMLDGLFGVDDVEDGEQFAAAMKNGGLRQRSFLQMSSFANFSAEHSGHELVQDLDNGILYTQLYGVQYQDSTALSPKGYTPHLWNVGTQLSNKVMFADGARYYSDDLGLTMDIRIIQSPAFNDDSSSGPIFDGSVAYGRGAVAASSGDHLERSFRKNGGEGMYVTMFDGSLQYLTREEAWTDPTPWYPSGSVWTGNGATAESQAWVKKNLPDGVIH